jgi:hypothetical protein
MKNRIIKPGKKKHCDELRKEYDLAKLKGGVRGKYTARYKIGTNLVLFAPSVAEHFRDEQSVDSTLRGLIRDAKRPARRASPLGGNRPLA